MTVDRWPTSSTREDTSTDEDLLVPGCTDGLQDWRQLIAVAGGVTYDYASYMAPGDIAQLYINKLTRTMERQGKVIDVTDAALDLLTEKGFSPAYGARFLKRYIDQKVKLPITNQWKNGRRFTVDAEEGEIVVKPADKPAEVFSLN